MKSQESKIQQAGDMLSDTELLYLKKTFCLSFSSWLVAGDLYVSCFS